MMHQNRRRIDFLAKINIVLIHNIPQPTSKPIRELRDIKGTASGRRFFLLVGPKILTYGNGPFATMIPRVTLSHLVRKRR